MQTIRDLDALRRARQALTGSVAFVPTMGALHAGHMALVAEARARADHIIASIFVNPTQFGPNEDLSRYPRQDVADATMLAEADVALLWLPDVATMYPAGFATTTVSVTDLGDILDGASRPGHFDGVATVVAKLFGQVHPDIALFGEKDWQQLAVIRRMTADLNLGIEIIGVPTSREADGLARSSRNVYLTPAEREAARALPETLLRTATAIAEGKNTARSLAEARAALEAAGFTVDYVELWDERLLAAARIGTTRLIDNVAIASPHP